MPTPREAGKKHNSLSGEPSDYCGACGLPKKECTCGQYKGPGESPAKGQPSTDGTTKED